MRMKIGLLTQGDKGTSWSIMKQRERKGRQRLPTCLRVTVLKLGECQCSLRQHMYSNRVNVFPATNAGAPEGAWKTRSPPGQSSRCIVTATCWNCWRHIHVFSFIIFWASLVSQMVKNLPAMQETQIESLGQEDPLEEEMATHSRILTWEIPWMEEQGGLQSMGLQRVGHSWVTNTFTLSF